MALFGAGEGESAFDCRDKKADCLLAGVLRTLLSGAVILGTWFVTLGGEFFETSELFRLCFLPCCMNGTGDNLSIFATAVLMLTRMLSRLGEALLS